MVAGNFMIKIYFFCHPVVLSAKGNSKKVQLKRSRYYLLSLCTIGFKMQFKLKLRLRAVWGSFLLWIAWQQTLAEMGCLCQCHRGGPQPNTQIWTELTNRMLGNGQLAKIYFFKCISVLPVSRQDMHLNQRYVNACDTYISCLIKFY